MRRNLLKNFRKGSKKATPKVAPKAKTRFRPRARRPQMRSDGEDLETAGAPSLKHRSVWAYLVEHAEIVFAPTRILFHLLMDAVLARSRRAWDDDAGTWTSYYERVYLRKERVSAQKYGLEEIWGSDWWSGCLSASGERAPGSTQQPAEQANAKYKRDMKSQGRLTTHAAVAEALQAPTAKSVCWSFVSNDTRETHPTISSYTNPSATTVL